MVLNRRHLLSATAALAISASLIPNLALSGPLDPSDATWESIQGDLFDNVEFKDGSQFLSLDAPDRAEDAAIVPLGINVKGDLDIEKISLVVDENPVPLAATFVYGPASTSPSFKTRIRVNAYSYVRVVAHTKDGSQYMIKKFVKASGGCSAPAGKDPTVANLNMGKMKFRKFEGQGQQEAQLMIRHPNHSGFQMDQVSMLYVPANFVDVINIKQGDDLIMKVEGGISLAEDPNLRFFYKDDPKKAIEVTAEDSDKSVFSKTWKPGDS